MLSYLKDINQNVNIATKRVLDFCNKNKTLDETVVLIVHINSEAGPAPFYPIPPKAIRVDPVQP